MRNWHCAFWKWNPLRVGPVPRPVAPRLAAATAPLSSPPEAPPLLPLPPSHSALRLPCSPPPTKHLRESNRRLYTRPTPLPAATAWPDADREHRAGRRARRLGGALTSTAGGARAQMPRRMIRHASPSREIDDLAHARAVRGVEVMGSETISMRNKVGCEGGYPSCRFVYSGRRGSYPRALNSSDTAALASTIKPLVSMATAASLALPFGPPGRFPSPAQQRGLQQVHTVDTTLSVMCYV